MRDFMTAPLGYIDMRMYCGIFREYTPYSIKLNWRGEPLLHKQLPYLIRIAKDRGVHEVSLNTNGQLLTKDIAQRLANAGLDWLIISVDGVYKDTYESIRIGGDFNLLIQNIINTRMLYDSIKDSPKIRLQICKQPCNENELDTWTNFFKKFADKLRIGNLFDPQGKRGLRVTQPKSCNQLWQRLTISWEGNILPCPSDYMEQYKLGNIKDTLIYDAWHSHQLNYYRNTLSMYGRQALGLCSKCSSYC